MEENNEFWHTQKAEGKQGGLERVGLLTAPTRPYEVEEDDEGWRDAEEKRANMQVRPYPKKAYLMQRRMSQGWRGVEEMAEHTGSPLRSG
jgi:hypothetical protein